MTLFHYPAADIAATHDTYGFTFERKFMTPAQFQQGGNQVLRNTVCITAGRGAPVDSLRFKPGLSNMIGTCCCGSYKFNRSSPKQFFRDLGF